ncbi:Ribosomal Protein S6 Kinase Alpha-5 [Manis pentadactyla]|nr:Ribosomal Protein S6 Kinase Alpha-5 [Manis pentadactyla]
MILMGTNASQGPTQSLTCAAHSEERETEKGEVSAEEEGFENLSTMASTFIVLFLLSLFYSTTVTLFKVARNPGAHSQTPMTSCAMWKGGDTQLSFLTIQGKPGPYRCRIHQLSADSNVEKNFRWPSRRP